MMRFFCFTTIIMEDLKVLYEDNHLIAVFKPAGWLVQGDITGDLPLVDIVKEYVKIRYKKPGDVFLGVIHRIDRPVSGVVIFARTSKGLSRMNDLFREREVKKKYWAITNTRPKDFSGTLTHWIEKDEERNMARASNSKKSSKAKQGSLSYHLNASIDNHHLIAVELHTGRPHQIRVQLSKIGMPIRGDVKYGSNKVNEDEGRIHLHAYSIEFEHPIKRVPIKIVIPPPNEQVWNKFKYHTKDFLMI